MIVRNRRREPDETTRALFDACDALMVVLDCAAKSGDEDLYRETKLILLATFALAESRVRH